MIWILPKEKKNSNEKRNYYCFFGAKEKERKSQTLTETESIASLKRRRHKPGGEDPTRLD